METYGKKPTILKVYNLFKGLFTIKPFKYVTIPVRTSLKGLDKHEEEV